jgi:proline iminopeptidase
MLDVGDGNLVYWETCGNPDGKPAVVVHGGPGSGCTPGWRRFFNPAAYRIVLFDQRGCGRSTPLAGDPATDLSTNTTPHLIADMERLRRHLGIDRWLLFGGSWGSTLGLAYAQRHPERVSEIVLVAVTTGRRREIDWITQDVGRIFPEQWARFRDGVPPAERDGRLVEAYARLLNDPDPAVRERAARDWCDWEDTHVSLAPDHQPSERYQDPEFRMTFARLTTHYWSNDCFLEDGVLLREASRLTGIPGVLVHGRYDVSGPLDTAWELARAWPDADLIVVDDAGHYSGSMTGYLVAATDRFARTSPGG